MQQLHWAFKCWNHEIPAPLPPFKFKCDDTIKVFLHKRIEKIKYIVLQNRSEFFIKATIAFWNKAFLHKPVCKPSENHISNINLTNASVFVINPKSPTEPLQIFSIVDNWHLKDWRIKCFLGEKFDWKEESNKRTCDNLTVIKTNMGQLGVMEGIGEGSEIAKVVRITCNCA